MGRNRKKQKPEGPRRWCARCRNSGLVPGEMIRDGIRESCMAQCPDCVAYHRVLQTSGPDVQKRAAGEKEDGA